MTSKMSPTMLIIAEVERHAIKEPIPIRIMPNNAANLYFLKSMIFLLCNDLFFCQFH